MQIYFSGSIRGGRQDIDLYAAVIAALKPHGTVLTEFVAANDLSLYDGDDTETEMHAKSMQKLEAADVLVAEITTPSLGVGYEIAKAEDLKKPILCLFRNDAGRQASVMIAGSPDVKFKTYDAVSDLSGILEAFFRDVVKG